MCRPLARRVPPHRSSHAEQQENRERGQKRYILEPWEEGCWMRPENVFCLGFVVLVRRRIEALRTRCVFYYQLLVVNRRPTPQKGGSGFRASSRYMKKKSVSLKAQRS